MIKTIFELFRENAPLENVRVMNLGIFDVEKCNNLIKYDQYYTVDNCKEYRNKEK